MRAQSASAIRYSGYPRDALDALQDGVQDVTRVELDGLFDQTFARQLLVGTDGALVPDDRITAYQNAHPRLKPTSERHYYDRNIYSAAAKIYKTNFKNVLRVGIDDRVRAFCKRFGDIHHLTKTERVAMLYQLNG
jgi:hypothetical protein